MPTLKSHSPRSPSIGPIVSRSLDNGFRIHVKEYPLAPTASLQLWVRTGSVHEGDNLGCGLSHFLEHMVFFGSRRNPKLDISREVSEFGGDVNAYTAHGHTVYHADVPADAVERTLKTLIDTVVEPLFPKRKFVEEKEVILREKAMDADDPERFLAEKMGLEMFKIHPFRHPIIGYLEKIETVDRRMMMDYHAARYTPARCFLVVVGDVDAERIVALSEKRSSDWRAGMIAEPVLPVEPGQACQRRAAYPFDDPMTRLSITCHTPAGAHPDVPALDVLAGLLGQGRSARLRRELRDEKRLAVGVEAYHYAPEFQGVFGLSLLGEPKKARAMEAEAFKQIARVRDGDVVQAEVKRIVNQQWTSYLRELRSNATVAQIIGNSILAFDAPDYADVYLRRLKKVRTSDVVEVARRYLILDNSTVIVSSPPAAARTSKAARGGKRRGPSAPSREKRRSGARLITCPCDSLPLANVCVILPGGNFFEDDDSADVTKLLCDVLFGGTRSFSESRLARTLDEAGVNLSVFGGANTISFHLEGQAERMAPGLRVLESMFTEPSFAAETVERERSNRVNRLKSWMLSPHHAGEDALTAALYGAHPYGRSAAMRIKSVARLENQDLASFFHRTCLTPKKAVFGVGGDFKTSGLLDEVRRMIDRLPWNSNHPLPRVDAPTFPAKSTRRRVVVPRQQAVIMKGIPGCAMRCADRHSLDALQVALNGPSSRLFETIRNERGLAYYTGLEGTSGAHRGFLSFYAGTRPDAADAVDELLEKERRALAERGLTKSEFDMARARIRHDLALRSLDVKELLFNSCLSEFYGNGYLEPWRCERIFQRLTRREVNRIVRRYFDTASIVTVVAGPES